MTRVDFFVLRRGGDDPYLTSCRLAAKASAQSKRVYLHVASEADAVHLDELLWTFKDISFVPHKLATDASLPDAQVLIGCEEPPAESFEVLVNLAREIPPFFSRFERVIELVAHAEPDRTEARKRYRFYRDRGYPLETHEL